VMYLFICIAPALPAAACRPAQHLAPSTASTAIGDCHDRANAVPDARPLKQFVDNLRHTTVLRKNSIRSENGAIASFSHLTGSKDVDFSVVPESLRG
jgi:hypothetical protein